MITHRIAALAGILALGAVGAGCGLVDDTGETQQFLDATPDEDGLVLEITGDSSERVEVEIPGGDERPEFLDGARRTLRHVNQRVHEVLRRVRELAQSDRCIDYEGRDARVCGPFDRGAVTLRLVIKKLGERRFAWRLDGKPIGSRDAAYVAIMAGSLARGDRAHRGRGELGIDLDALRSIDPDATGQGKLFAAFSHIGEAKTLVYRLRGFTHDPSEQDPVNAAFVGHFVPGRGARIRLAALHDHPGTATDARELVQSRVRWVFRVGGRADLRITGGDIAPERMLVGHACWDVEEREVFKVLLDCARGSTDRASCRVLRMVGEPSACGRGLEAEEAPPEDADDITLEPDGPVAGSLEPPARMPTGNE